MYIHFRYRIYPSSSIQKKLITHREECRWLYNRLLEEIKNAYKSGRKISQLDTQALIVKIKETERPKLKEVYAKVLQIVNFRIWYAIRSLCRRRKKGFRGGDLRFKGKNQFKSINYNQYGFKIEYERRRLTLSKIGEIPIKIHRKIKGRIKGVIIKQYSSGKWFAIFQTEIQEEMQNQSRKRVVGIDMGLKFFITDSYGRQFENPKFYHRMLNQIRKAHKEYSRKTKGSRNQEKARIHIARVYEKLRNQRDDFLHKLSRFYVDNYDVIIIENLMILKMIRSKWIGQGIIDASWKKFFDMLTYKAERAGGTVIKVNPRGTSKQKFCSLDLDRDYNAALNIHKRGVGRPLPPVKRGPLRCIPAVAVIAGKFSR
ncbi:MAG: RNA-guided endonuclease InsQ/TnpB family protein [Promethearchaeota archaeon]